MGKTVRITVSEKRDTCGKVDIVVLDECIRRIATRE